MAFCLKSYETEIKQYRFCQGTSLTDWSKKRINSTKPGCDVPWSCCLCQSWFQAGARSDFDCSSLSLLLKNCRWRRFFPSSRTLETTRSLQCLQPANQTTLYHITRITWLGNLEKQHFYHKHQHVSGGQCSLTENSTLSKCLFCGALSACDCATMQTHKQWSVSSVKTLCDISLPY